MPRLYAVYHWNRPAHGNSPYIGTLVVPEDRTLPALWWRGWTTPAAATPQRLPRAAAAALLRRYRRAGAAVGRQG